MTTEPQAAVTPVATGRVLLAVAAERGAQDGKWGQQNHPDGTGPEACWMFDDPETGWRLSDALRADTQRRFAAGKGTWLHVLLEEVGEAFAEDDPEKLRAELIQVAAVAVAWVEAIDRRQRPSGVTGRRLCACVGGPLCCLQKQSDDGGCLHADCCIGPQDG